MRLELQESFANATQPSFLSGLLWKVSASEKSVVPEKKESPTIPENIVDHDGSSNSRLMSVVPEKSKIIRFFMSVMILVKSFLSCGRAQKQLQNGMSRTC